MSLNRIPRKRRSIFYHTISREYGFCGMGNFELGVSHFFHDKKLLQDPDIVSPHRKSITSMAVDSSDRFVLAGSADACISIYDISKWGRSTMNLESSDYSAVAKSMKVPAAVDNILQLPAGHSSSIDYTQWYPTDAGVFLSASSDGNVLVWDTSRVQPVMRVRPFEENSAWVSAHLRTGGDFSLLAAGSWHKSDISMVDIRCGSSTQLLIGHSDGISSLQWSPSNSHILASGSRDSTVRLFDIRKSGSRACVTVLDREQTLTFPVKSYSSDYTHLRQERQRGVMVGQIAPNNYKHVQHQRSRSHRSGHISALSFFSSGHYLCSVGGLDGELLLWDLRSGFLLKNKFLIHGNLPPALPKQRRTALCVEGSGYTDSCNKRSVIYIGRDDRIYGFSVCGAMNQTLRGSNSKICSLCLMDHKLLSGSSDGMILGWGQSRSANFTKGCNVSGNVHGDKDQW